MKVLLIAYGCEPGVGSEPGNGWQWAAGLARNHEVTVLTHPRGRDAIRRVVAAAPGPHPDIEYVELPARLDPWTRVGSDDRIHRRYVLWQVAAYVSARRLARIRSFDLVHHVSWGTVTGPTIGWALGLPFVWGPLGGGQQAPQCMREVLGTAWAMESLRNLRVALARYAPWVLAAARRTSVALATNYETRDTLLAAGARQVGMMVDSAVDPAWVPPEPPRRPAKPDPVVVWVGRFSHHKAPLLAIEAFARVRQQRPAQLWMVGDGQLLGAAKQAAALLGLEDSVRFVGRVDHADVPLYLEGADVFLFTSLRDSFQTSVLEAMARGLPVVTLDHQGMRLLPDSVALRVPVTGPQQVREDLAGALLALLGNTPSRLSMGRAAWEYVTARHTWPTRIVEMDDVYASVLRRTGVPCERLGQRGPA